MSLIAGMHLGDFALIAADKREMAILGNTLIPAHDDANKIINAGIGYITGSGIVELLDTAKQLIASNEITHTDQIVSIINSSKQQFRSRHANAVDWADDQIQKTGWMFTYLTEEYEQQIVRIAMVHGAWKDDRLRILLKGNAKVLVPIDGSADESERFSKILMDNLKTTDEVSDFSKNVSFHIPLLQEIFKYSSEQCESVSESFHIAVQMKNGDMLCSKEILRTTSKIEFER
ncbi:MAG: hypothetical protein CVU51_06470 [Deltaproteobacteria bacterium HGW-Deltaproteobacteria-1]|jgi:hypothetical protein|nr:MAG: hypothetical protein CVU51_06470 [Deltaproteobacteria bacterium HGW-Deltaproteobacteria-1]